MKENDHVRPAVVVISMPLYVIHRPHTVQAAGSECTNSNHIVFPPNKYMVL